ncbi:hypothetical protein [Bacillus sp. Marseille-P3661]|uniref:hypothetical protein n=1 Tax=Bacillus sp. Marseille-P3661 TaxID=1936234 RepID=UPI000C835E97|nr:hypothetical protein [Bacillus sp. Marseille-P3661]
MNANGTARAYMAKGMNAMDFLNYVLNCIDRELKEWGFETANTLVRGNTINDYIIALKINHKDHFININLQTVKNLQTKGVYALDRLLWDVLKNNGIELKYDHYLETVYNIGGKH